LDFDVSTVPGILNTPGPCLIQRIEESLGNNSSPTTSILSSAHSVLILWRNESKKLNLDLTGVMSWWGTTGPDVLHSGLSGNLARARDGTTKSRPSSSWIKTDRLPRWEH